MLSRTVVDIKAFFRKDGDVNMLQAGLHDKKLLTGRKEVVKMPQAGL